MVREVTTAGVTVPGVNCLRESLLGYQIFRERSLTINSAVDSEPSSSTRKAGRSSNRLMPRISAAAQCEDMDLDEEPLVGKEQRNQLPRQILTKIVIPVNGRSSTTSSLSSGRDQSSEYDTPGTSAVVTPAGSLVKEQRSLIRASRISNSMPPRQPEKPLKRRRKRSAADELLDADALFAQKLQEQEYGEDQEVAPRPRRAKKGVVEDSEDESLVCDFGDHSPDAGLFQELDVPISARSNRRGHKALLFQATSSNVEDDSSGKGSLSRAKKLASPMPKSKRVKANCGTSLPSRAARDSANQSIRDETSRRILDSEDSELSDLSDDLSLFSSDSGSDAFEESGDEDEEAGEVVDAANNPSLAPMTIPATGRHGRGGARSTQGRRTWQRRVEDRVRPGMLLILHAGLRHTLGCQRATKIRESAS